LYNTQTNRRRDFKASLFLASISKKLLRRKIMKWYAERKFNFGEIANFQEPRPPANIRPQRIEQAGEPQNFAAPASKKARPRAGFCGGLPRTPSQPGNITRPSGEYRLGATNPLKQRSDFSSLRGKIG
jgi:hypothetical protein